MFPMSVDRIVRKMAEMAKALNEHAAVKRAEADRNHAAAIGLMQDRDAANAEADRADRIASRVDGILE